MNKKNILIATQSLGIGGCESYILTQCLVFKKRGYNVVVIAARGEMVNEFQKIGVKFVDFDFMDKSQDNIHVIEKIIEDEEITQVHIHPFYPFYGAVVASIRKNIPYILYFHGISLKGAVDIEGIFNWAIGDGISTIYLNSVAFKNASRYAYVSNEVKAFYESNFSLELSKGINLHNSVFLRDEFSTMEESCISKRFIAVSRLDNEKIESVKMAIDFYIKYCDECKKNGENLSNFVLDICGTGNNVKELENYIESKKDYNISLIGSSTEVIKLMKNYDAVFGMGRCILETMACGKVPILVGYDKYVGIIDSREGKRILEIANSNFSGRNTNEGTSVKDINKLLDKNYSKNSLILNNYNYISKYRNAEKIFSNYVDDIDKIKCLYDTNTLENCQKVISKNIQFENDNKKMIDMYENLNKDFKSILDKFNNTCKELDVIKAQKIELKNELEVQEKENKKLKQDLDTERYKNQEIINEIQIIKNSKFYKIYKVLLKKSKK